MSLLERYRALYEYETDCNHKMLVMLESVPEANRSDARFQQAVTLADHLAAGREKWLDYMEGQGPNPVAWWDARCDLVTLRPVSPLWKATGPPISRASKKPTWHMISSSPNQMGNVSACLSKCRSFN